MTDQAHTDDTKLATKKLSDSEFDHEISLLADASLAGVDPAEHLIERIRAWELSEKDVIELIAIRCWDFRGTQS